MDILHQIQEIAVQSTLFETGCVEVSRLKFYSEVRAICERNNCRAYGTSWACPPAAGSIEECREQDGQYAKMLLFSICSPWVISRTAEILSLTELLSPVTYTGSL